MRIFLTQVLPLLLPLAIYLIWLQRARRNAAATGAGLPPVRDAPWPWMIGAALAAGISIYLAWLLGAPEAVVGSLAPKSITTPIAVEVAKSTDGLVSLTAGAVAITGIVGALLGGLIFRLLRVHDDRIRGFALGLVAHAIGTARAFEYGEKAGAFASLALGLTGLLTALALPWLWPWVSQWLFAGG